MQGLMSIGKEVSLVLLLMEQFILAYKCSRKKLMAIRIFEDYI